MQDKEGEEAVQEAAEDQREGEVEVIKKEERKVKRAATMAKKKVPVAVAAGAKTLPKSAAVSVPKKAAPKKAAPKKPAAKKTPAKKPAPKKKASGKKKK
jgi:hypothetical protein